MKLFLSAILILSISVFAASCSNSKKPKLRSISPSEMVFQNTEKIEFEFARADEGKNSKDLPNCDLKGEGSKTAVKLMISETGNHTTDENIHKDVVFEKDIEIPNNCIYKQVIQEAGELRKDQAYAWRVVEAKDDAKAIKWMQFVQLTEYAALIVDPYVCEKNLVQEPSFYVSKEIWKQGGEDSVFTPLTNTEFYGADDSYAAQLTTSENVITQTLSSPILVNKSYQLKFSFKVHDVSDPVQIKAIAFRGASINTGIPNSNVAVMGMTGFLHPHANWQRVSLDVWFAHAEFDQLALVAITEEGLELAVDIDRVCLADVSRVACQEESIPLGESAEFPGDFEFGAAPVVTEFEYLQGSLIDLYPNEDTSTINWYADQASSAVTSLPCAVDNETDEEAEADEETLQDYLDEDEEYDDLSDELEDYPSPGDLNALADPPFSTTDLLPIPSIPGAVKCKGKILDPTKPFSGRDIVYVHGLQVAALKGNVLTPKTFQGKWPADKDDFYKTLAGNGEVYEEAEHYWENHIEHTLGSVTNPTNSYLIANWSANQRLDYAIHALLTQIRDGMAGENLGVVQSTSAEDNEQCFGDNGIVVVTHSTAGLVVSSMFGVSEASHIQPQINTRFGDTRFITDKIDAQLGIDCAYTGSKVAKFFLASLTEIAMDPVLLSFLNSEIVESRLGFNPAPGIALLSNWWDSILVDLTPEGAESLWVNNYMASSIPTITTVGALAGVSDETGQSGSFSFLRRVVKGFDDGVLSPSTQTSHAVRKPVFRHKRKRFLKDKGVERKKRLRMVADGRKQSGSGKRNYYITPYLAPSGMLQHQSVESMVDLPNNFIGNHHSLLQSTGDHLDGVDEIVRNGNRYSNTKNGIHNYEESSVVFNSALYSTGLVNPAFGTLTQQWERKKTWGFSVPSVAFYKWGFRFHSKYIEFTKWKRHYHFLKDYKTKMGVDYAYDYVLRQ